MSFLLDGFVLTGVAELGVGLIVQGVPTFFFASTQAYALAATRTWGVAIAALGALSLILSTLPKGSSQRTAGALVLVLFQLLNAAMCAYGGLYDAPFPSYNHKTGPFGLGAHTNQYGAAVGAAFHASIAVLLLLELVQGGGSSNDKKSKAK